MPNVNLPDAIQPINLNPNFTSNGIYEVKKIMCFQNIHENGMGIDLPG